MPRVSVLLPVHNAAATLPAALSSLSRQTLTDWECVAVDDGSTDDSARLLRDAAVREPRLVVLRQAHAGIVSALNAGLARCRGEYVARFDADDLMHRERLQLQAEALGAAPSWAGLGCHVRLFPRRGLRDGRRHYEAWLNGIRCAEDVSREAFVECPLAHPSLLLRRSVLLTFGYRDRGWPEDYDLVLRLLGAGEVLGVVPRRLLAWRDGPGRLSRTGAAYALSRFVACKAAFLAESWLAGREHYVLWGYGDTGRTLAKALLEHGRRPSVIVEVHPGRIGQRIAGARVIPPEGLASLPLRPIIVSVAGSRPRAEVRQALARLGCVEGFDYVCAA